jgi:hypothetical protein
MKNGILILAGALLLAPAAPLAGQTMPSHPASERGQHSLLVSTNGSSQIGYWVRKSDRTDIGLEVGGFGDFGRGQRQLGVTATPALKHYLSATGPFTPYTYVGIPLSYQRASSDLSGAATHQYGVGGVFGLGLDWFPWSRLSLGAHAALSGVYIKPNGDGGIFSVRTYTSGIRAQLYF